jgi:two-component system cell cycle sensor histidine kinase/response regulator CckA
MGYNGDVSRTVPRRAMPRRVLDALTAKTANTVATQAAWGASVGAVVGAIASVALVRSGRQPFQALVTVEGTALLLVITAVALRSYHGVHWQRALAKIEADRAEDHGPEPDDQVLLHGAARLQSYADALRQVMGARLAVVLLASSEDALSVGAWTTGSEAVFGQHGELARRGFLERSANSRRPVFSEVAALDPSDELYALGTGWVAACRMTLDGKLLGIVVVVRDGSRRLGLLARAAQGAAPAIERARLDDAERRSRLGAEHARRHLALIAGASSHLAPALSDYRPALEALSGLMVPEHADWFAVDIVTASGALDTVVCTGAAPEPSSTTGQAGAEWTETMKRVVRAGQSMLVTDVRRPSSSRGADETDDGHAFMALEQGLQSWAVVPMRARGLSIGAISVGTRGPRRGLRASDVSAFEELATRCALTVERVLLYDEARRTAVAAEQRASELFRAVEAVSVITDSLSAYDVMQRAVSQVSGVMGADQALVSLATGIGDVGASWSAGHMTTEVATAMSEANRHALAANRIIWDETAPGCIAVPFSRRDGASRGALAVTVSQGHEPGSDEQSLLLLLAQVTSAAIGHAETYEASTRGQDRLRALLEASPLAIVELDSLGRVSEWNPAAASLFEWETRAPSAGLALQPGPESAELFSSLGMRLRSGEQIVDERAKIVRPHGGSVDVSIAAAALAGLEGEAGGLLLVLADISDRLRMEDELQEKRRMEALGRLAGGVAHDFNNLLTVIIGYTDLIARRMGPSSHLGEDIAAVQAASKRAVALTEQLLTISRRRVIEPAVFEVNDALEDLLDILRPLIGEDVSLQVDLDPEAGKVRMDQGQLEQVVLNLVVNSRDAMPSGGSLSITTAQDLDQDRVILRVSDTGCGMDTATMDRCFEPFFTTRARDQGTGLGLATVYSIVAEAGGAIDVDSAVGAGTSFSVTLPRVDAPSTQLPSSAGDLGAAAGCGVTVLLVEDQQEVRDFAERVLRDAGYEVLVASSGDSALATAAAMDGELGLLVTDVVMPGMSGPELAQTMLQVLGDLPVLYMSGYPDHHHDGDDEAQSLRCFLAKPFGPDRLIEAVERTLAGAPLEPGPRLSTVG